MKIPLYRDSVPDYIMSTGTLYSDQIFKTIQKKLNFIQVPSYLLDNGVMVLLNTFAYSKATINTAKTTCTIGSLIAQRLQS